MAALPPPGATKRQLRDFLRNENCRLADILETKELKLEELEKQIEAVLGSYRHMKLDLEFHQKKTSEFESKMNSLLHQNGKYKSDLRGTNLSLQHSNIDFNYDRRTKLSETRRKRREEEQAKAAISTKTPTGTKINTQESDSPQH